MPANAPRMFVTAASGQLGRLVVECLLATVPPERIAAGVRNPASAADLASRGIELRVADYTRPDTLEAAFQDVDRLLLISSNELGSRAPQHRNAIEAAKRAGVGQLAYTSLLHADTSTLGLAAEHRETEAMLRSAGIPWVLLRNGWYTENYLASLPSVLAHKAVLGSAGEGRIASAARADYAEAAARVLTSEADLAGQVLELAGDEAYTLNELATEIGRQAGSAIAYVNLPEAEYRATLVRVGLPEPLAALLADSDAAAEQGALFDQGGTLGRLIGRRTTPMAASVAAALAQKQPVGH